MKRVLVTGALGFIGRNTAAELGRFPESYELLLTDLDTPEPVFLDYISTCDFVIHLAGVNRPKDEGEFKTGNTGLTERLCGLLAARGQKTPVLMTSSIQSDLDNPYGQSKRAAEEALLAYGRETGAPVYVFKLPNVFGKWCRSNYNSAVATFCHNIANGLPITVNDPERVMTLIYIDDLLALIKRALEGSLTPGEDGYCAASPVYTAKLGYIADKLRELNEGRKTLVMPALEGIAKPLYSTLLSYLPEREGFAYELVSHADARGLFAEILKTGSCGQFSVSTSLPGVTRGNHWHHTKVEKFVVVAGEAAIRFRRVDGGESFEYRVSGEKPTVVDIPVGYTHSITNVSPSETLVTLIWANELFDPERPDTYYLEV